MNRYKLSELVEKIKADESVMKTIYKNDESFLLWNLISCDPVLYEELLVIYKLI